jgi:hypothetical protein
MFTPKRLLALAALAVLPAVAVFASGALPAAQASPRPSEYILPGATVFPEGVTYQQGTGYFYVSSTTDGTIFRGNLWEEMTSVFLPGGEDGRTTAVGLEADAT